MSRVDLVGQIFNRLTVVKLSDKKKGTIYFEDLSLQDLLLDTSTFIVKEV